MNNLFIGTFIVLIVCSLAALWVFVQKAFNQINQQMTQHLLKQGELLQQTHEGVGNRLEYAAKAIVDLQSRLAKMEETNLKIFEVGKDIASLQQILKAPKLRGNLGELFLGDLLKQILPLEHFELQYTFKNSEKVDAIVKMEKNFVSIDAKFPLENFKKYIEAYHEVEKKQFRKVFLNDIKKHIDAISSKYIKPDEGSFDFALMYIPAENVYYEMIIKEDAFDSGFSIMDYAMSKKVIPVSPNNFYVYLHTVLMGLKGLKVESSAKEILSNLASLQGDLQKVGDEFSKLGTHLFNARAVYDLLDKRLNKINQKLEIMALPQETLPLVDQQVNG